MTDRFSVKSKRAILLLGAPILLQACAVASGITPQEAEVRDHVAVDRFMPATREMRDNIETQELFAQAAFWSHEYELNPTDLEATIKLAAAVRKLGNPGRAVEITQTSRAIHPRDPYLLAEHAAGLIADERALDAVPVLDQGLRIAPAYARLWSLKGAALDQMEEYQSARQHYARALQITPHDPNILANLGLSHALSGDPATAETWLRRAADQPGASAGVRQNLALVLQLQGRTEDANQQVRLSKLTRGDRKLPPEPVPAFTPRGVPAQMTQQGGQAPVMRGAIPQTRLTTTAPNGEAFTSSSQAARMSAGSTQSKAQQPVNLRRSAPMPGNGEMTAEQMAVLNTIRQSLQPGAVGPQSPSTQTGSESSQQPYLVGPAVLQQNPQGYAPQATTAPYGYTQPAQVTTQRGPARRRR